MRGRSEHGLPLLLCLIGAGLLLQGCLATAFQSRPQIAASIARDADWQPLNIDTDGFLLRAYLPKKRTPRKKIILYVEGDGLAWNDRVNPSNDPTPGDPIALRMAVASGARAAAYIARPCQYTLPADSERCHPAFWTNGRYAEPVLSAMSQAVDRIKSIYAAESLVLVGYSGGGVIAALLSTRRDDVSLLVTVAANLDTAFWTQHHKVAPLEGSLNPVNFPTKLKRLRQIHLVGTDDVVVPPSVVRSYTMKVNKALLETVRYVDDANHTCCWADLWPALARDILPHE